MMEKHGNNKMGELLMAQSELIRKCAGNKSRLTEDDQKKLAQIEAELREIEPQVSPLDVP